MVSTITRFKVVKMGIGKYVALVVATGAIAAGAIYASCKLPYVRRQVEVAGDYVSDKVNSALEKMAELDSKSEEHMPGPVKKVNDGIRKTFGKEPRHENQ
jgi:hypothetical protein